MEEKEKDKIRGRLIGRNVKLYRKKSGLTQEEMSKHLNIPRPSFTLIESGKRNLTAVELFRLSIVIGKSPSAIFKDIV